MEDERYLHSTTTSAIIGCFYTVYNCLGSGFAEIVYRNALCIEMAAHGLDAQCEVPLKVYYENKVVGSFRADLLVDERVVVELKTVSTLRAAHGAQLHNYLKSSRYEVGLLLNFGPCAEVQRKTFTNDFKGHLRWCDPPIEPDPSDMY